MNFDCNYFYVLMGLTMLGLCSLMVKQRKVFKPYKLENYLCQKKCLSMQCIPKKHASSCGRMDVKLKWTLILQTKNK